MAQDTFHVDDPEQRARRLRHQLDSAEAFNPWLGADLGNKGTETTLETPERVRNICWQHRARPPNAYESRLADTLGEIFADGVWDLAGVVARLNAAGLPTPSGAPWSETNFEPELDRLGRGL